VSLAAVRQALEQRLDALLPALETGWENQDFDPPSADPFQEVQLLPTEPDNPEFGPLVVEQGILQVTLCYPLGAGPAAAAARAELVQAQFARGTSLVQGGVVVTIERTPEIGVALIDDARYRLPVRVRWYANVGG